MPRIRSAVTVHIIGVVGLCVIGVIATRVNLHTLLTLVASVGPAAFLRLCIWSLVLSCALGAAWAALLPKSFAIKSGAVIWARIVRDSAGEVLPFSQLGGFVAGVRAVVQRGVPASLAMASSVADVAVETAAQFVFVMLGVALAAQSGRVAPAFGVAVPSIIACLAVTLLVAPSWLATLVLASFVTGGLASILQQLQASLKALYASPLRVSTAFMLHLLAWLGSAVTVVIAAQMLRAHICLSDAIIIETSVSSIRSVAFFVPGTFGVQEGGYMLMLAAMGSIPELGLAISLLKRAREFGTGHSYALDMVGARGRTVLQNEKLELSLK